MFVLVVQSFIRSGIIIVLLILEGVHGGGGGVAADLHVLVPHTLQTLVHETETNTGLVGKLGANRDGTASIHQIKFRASQVNKYINTKLLYLIY